MSASHALPMLEPLPARGQDEHRIGALDVARGIVMVLMVLDHVRVFCSAEALGGLGQISAALFSMRWITHFCAPAFVFLAGAGAALRRSRGVGELSRYLALRGLGLILLEFTLIRFSWTFEFEHYQYFLAGVIWAIGVSMVLLAALVHLPRPALVAIGLILVCMPNAFDAHRQEWLAALQGNPSAWIWQVLYLGGAVKLASSGATLIVLYSIVPWVGVMSLGFAFGTLLRAEPATRRRTCFAIGGAAIAAFLVLRGFNVYGNPSAWASSERGPWFTVFSFLNTNKYPASLQYLLMTLGPLLMSLPLLERARGIVGDVLATLGRVPLFFYLLHIPLIHGLAIALAFVRHGSVDPWFFARHPADAPPTPEGLGYGVPAMLAITLVAVAILYWPCRAYAASKTRRRQASAGTP